MSVFKQRTIRESYMCCYSTKQCDVSMAKLVFVKILKSQCKVHA